MNNSLNKFDFSAPLAPAPAPAPREGGRHLEKWRADWGIKLAAAAEASGLTREKYLAIEQGEASELAGELRQRLDSLAVNWRPAPRPPEVTVSGRWAIGGLDRNQAHSVIARVYRDAEGRETFGTAEHTVRVPQTPLGGEPAFSATTGALIEAAQAALEANPGAHFRWNAKIWPSHRVRFDAWLESVSHLTASVEVSRG